MMPGTGKVPDAARKVQAGTGLTGGGDLTADRTLSADLTVLQAKAALLADSKTAGLLDDTATAALVGNTGTATGAALHGTLAAKRGFWDGPHARFMAHKSSEAFWADACYEGLDMAVASGFIWDADLQLLNTTDHDQAVTHDQSMLASRGVNLQTTDLTPDQFAAIPVLSAYTGGKPGTPLTLHRLLDRYAGVAPGTLETKHGDETETLWLLNRIVALGQERNILFSSFTYWQVQNAALLGIASCYLGTDKTGAQLVADGIEWALVGQATSSTVIDDYLANGIKLQRGGVDTRKLYLNDTYQSQVDFFECKDPWAVSNYYAPVSADSFESGSWWPGISIGGAAVANLTASYDRVNDGLAIKYLASDSTPKAVRLGQFGLGAVNGTYQFTLRFTPGASADDRYAVFFVGSLPSGLAFMNQADTDIQGYFVAVRRNGNRELNKRTSGSGTQTNLAASLSGNTPYVADVSSTGSDYVFQLSITPSGLTFTDVTRGLTLTSTDTSYRGTDAIVSFSTGNSSAILLDARVVR